MHSGESSWWVHVGEFRCIRWVTNGNLLLFSRLSRCSGAVCRSVLSNSCMLVSEIAKELLSECVKTD